MAAVRQSLFWNVGQRLKVKRAGGDSSAIFAGREGVRVYDERL